MVCGSVQYVHQHGISCVISKVSAFPSYSNLPWLHFYCTLVSVFLALPHIRMFNNLLLITYHLHVLFAKLQFSSSFICSMNWEFLSAYVGLPAK